jgi:hypothetical protein
MEEEDDEGRGGGEGGAHAPRSGGGGVERDGSPAPPLPEPLPEPQPQPQQQQKQQQQKQQQQQQPGLMATLQDMIVRLRMPEPAGLRRQEFEEVEARFREEMARRQEVEARQREETARLQAETARLNVIIAHYRGRYYSRVEQVWGRTEALPFADPAHFDRLRRGSAPDFVSPGRRQLLQYQTIVRDASDPNRVVATPKAVPLTYTSSTSSSSIDSTRTVWPVDLFGQKRHLSADVSSLIPRKGSAHSALYADVAICILGLQDDAADDDSDDNDKKRRLRGVPFDWDTLQKAIHGSSAPPPSSSFRPADPSEKAAKSGLKHSIPSTICLHGQLAYYDQYPCVLVVPILTLEQGKGWRGEGYDAVVLAGEFREETMQCQDLDDQRSPRVSISEVCQSIGMVREGRHATRDGNCWFAYCSGWRTPSCTGSPSGSRT